MGMHDEKVGTVDAQKKLQAQVGCGWVTRSLVSGHPYMVGFNWIWKEFLSGKGVHSNLSPVALAEMEPFAGAIPLCGDIPQEGRPPLEIP